MNSFSREVELNNLLKKLKGLDQYEWREENERYHMDYDSIDERALDYQYYKELDVI